MIEQFLNTDRGTQLRTIFWRSEQETDRIIFLVHSYGDSASRYDWLAQKFNRHGFHVVSFDLHAHGKSGGLKGKWNTIHDLIADVQLVQNYYNSTLPNFKWTGLGLGFGATLLHFFELQCEDNCCESYLYWSPLLKLSSRFPKVILNSIHYMNVFTSHLSVMKLQPTMFCTDTSSIYSIYPDWDDDFGSLSVATTKLIADASKKFLKTWALNTKSKWLGYGLKDQFVSQKEYLDFQRKNAEHEIEFLSFEEVGHYLDDSEASQKVVHQMLDWLAPDQEVDVDEQITVDKIAQFE